MSEHSKDSSQLPKDSNFSSTSKSKTYSDKQLSKYWNCNSLSARY